MRLSRAIVFPLAVAAVACALYAPTLEYPLRWDDQSILVEGVALTGEHPFVRALTAPYLSTISDSNYFQYYYRPASLLALALERAAFGVAPLGYRIVHTALHASNCLLVYAVLLLLLRRFSGQRVELAAALGALAFAVAPYGVDSVLLLTNLGDELVLASLCACVLSGFAYCESERPRHLVALFAAGAVCVFSKESGACLPLLLALCLFLCGVPARSRGFVRVVAMGALLTASMLLARFAALDAEPAPMSANQAATRALAGFGVAFRTALFPHPLSLEEDVSASFGLWLALGAAAAAALVFLCLCAKRRKLVALGAAWWAISLLPSLFTVAVNQTFSARYLYVPALGASVILAAACASVSRRRAAQVAVLGLIAAWSLFAVMRVVAWSDDLRLWAREVEIHPDRAVNFIRLSAALSSRGRDREAEALLRCAEGLSRENGDAASESVAHAGLCRLLVKRGDRDAALHECVAALEIRNDYFEAWMTLGNLHAADGAWDKAFGAFGEAVERTKNPFQALVSRAGAAAALGKRAEALSDLDRAQKAAEGSSDKLAELHRRRALVLEKLREVDKDR